MNVHEEILAPFSACFRVVAKHHPLQLHSQCPLRSKQRHTRLIWSAVALAVVTRHACGNDVYRRIITSTRTRQDVIERQLARTLLLATVLAAKLVAHVDPQTLRTRRLSATTHVDVSAPANHRRNR